MDQVVLLCVDGSEHAIAAAATGLARLASGGRTIVVTVVEGGNPTLVSGVSGMAGGALSPDQLQELNEVRSEEGAALLEAAVAALDRPGLETQVLLGEPGVELAIYAEEIGATTMVVGTRGHGAIKRALLGSVSDHLVRHAPCPVLVVRDEVED